MKNKMRSLLMLLSAFGVTLNAAVAETVTISASHARPGIGNKVTYETRCEDGVYRILFNSGDKTAAVQFQGPNGRMQDLDGTSFGVTARRPLYGRLAFTCWNPGGVNVFFFGLELRKGAQPMPVSYRLTLDSGGRIVADHGLQPEQISVVNSHLIDD